MHEKLPTLAHFCAQSGLCSRRKAIEMVKAGLVQVNGCVESNPAYRVQPDDQVRVDGVLLKIEEFEYVLLNKPEGYLTAVSDERGGRVVTDLIGAGSRLFPVGRLDLDTTGTLLLTNDGALAYKLTHPKFEIIKKYRATLDRNLTQRDAQKLLQGIELFDGPIHFDALSFVAVGGVEGLLHPANRNIVDVTLHSGRNRIIRRMFDHLGYTVVHLDRTEFAELTYGNLKRGESRLLNRNEIKNLLSM